MSKNLTLSPKYGVNPSLCVCEVCGKETGELVLYGRIGGKEHKDEEAPKYTPHGLCKDCQSCFDRGFKLILEVTDPIREDEKPQKTGRFVFVQSEGFEHYKDDKVLLCHHSDFEMILAKGTREEKEIKEDKEEQKEETKTE